MIFCECFSVLLRSSQQTFDIFLFLNYFSLSLSLTLSLSLSLSLSVSLSLSLSLSLFYLSPLSPPYLSPLSLSFSVCLYVSDTVMTLPLSVDLCPSLFVSLEWLCL
jgi:hypothetical protein